MRRPITAVIPLTAHNYPQTFKRGMQVHIDIMVGVHTSHKGERTVRASASARREAGA